MSATPSGVGAERERAACFVEQVIRPTGLIDPPVHIRPAAPPRSTTSWARSAPQPKPAYRSLVTVLTKRMAEDLTEYLHEQGIRVRYMHSDIDTIERIENHPRPQARRVRRAGRPSTCWREGLDIPECALVAILDADKEGFLRSETSLIQTIGRGRAQPSTAGVILYADQITGSMERGHRPKPTAAAKKSRSSTTPRTNITPESIKRSIHDIMNSVYGGATMCWVEIGDGGHGRRPSSGIGHNFRGRCWLISKTRMREAAADLNFEEAARLARRGEAVLRANGARGGSTIPPSSSVASPARRRRVYTGSPKQFGDAAETCRRGSTGLAAQTKRRQVRLVRRAAREKPARWTEMGPGYREPHLPAEEHGPKNRCRTPRRPHSPRKPPRGGASSSPGPAAAKIIQPTNSRESGPGVRGRRRGRAAGRRGIGGGWKKR